MAFVQFYSCTRARREGKLPERFQEDKNVSILHTQAKIFCFFKKRKKGAPSCTITRGTAASPTSSHKHRSTEQCCGGCRQKREMQPENPCMHVSKSLSNRHEDPGGYFACTFLFNNWIQKKKTVTRCGNISISKAEHCYIYGQGQFLCANAAWHCLRFACHRT